MQRTYLVLSDIPRLGRAPVRLKPCFVQVGVLFGALVLPTSVRRMQTGGLLHRPKTPNSLSILWVFTQGKARRLCTYPAGEKLTLSNENACFRLVKFRSLAPLRDALKIFDFQGPPFPTCETSRCSNRGTCPRLEPYFYCISGFLHRAKPEGYARTLQEKSLRFQTKTLVFIRSIVS